MGLSEPQALQAKHCGGEVPPPYRHLPDEDTTSRVGIKDPDDLVTKVVNDNFTAHPVVKVRGCVLPCAPFGTSSLGKVKERETFRRRIPVQELPVAPFGSPYKYGDGHRWSGESHLRTSSVDEGVVASLVGRFWCQQRGWYPKESSSYRTVGEIPAGPITLSN